MRPWYDPPFRPAAKTQPSSGAEPTKVASPQALRSLRRSVETTFRPTAKRSPCRAMAACQRIDPEEGTRDDHNQHHRRCPAGPTGRPVWDRPRASTITFKSRHLFGLAPVHGTMAISHGLVDIADPLTGSSVQVEIDTASFDTGSGHRDRDVRSPRFLDAERYPSMTFTSERLDRSDGRWTLTGTLLVRDVARPVSLAIERSTVPPGRPTSFVVCATTRIDRTDFGLTAAKGLAGRHLDISLRIQGCADDHQAIDREWLTRTGCRSRGRGGPGGPGDLGARPCARRGADRRRGRPSQPCRSRRRTGYRAPGRSGGMAGAATPCSPWGRWMVAICRSTRAGHLDHRTDRLADGMASVG